MTHIKLLLVLASLATVAGEYKAPLPTTENRSAWQSYLLPTEAEVSHESIPWLPSFGEGVLAADEQGKPLLFWGMNGHPLGCT